MIYGVFGGCYSEKDEVLNMFHGDEAEELYNKLITVAE